MQIVSHTDLFSCPTVFQPKVVRSKEQSIFSSNPINGLSQTEGGHAKIRTVYSCVHLSIQPHSAKQCKVCNMYSSVSFLQMQNQNMWPCIAS